MKKLIYGIAVLCLAILTACGPSHTEQVDKLAKMYEELEEIIQKDGADSQAAADKYGEIMNYNYDISKDFADFTPEERDYYAKVSSDGMMIPGVTEAAMKYNSRVNDSDFGVRPEDKSALDEAKEAVDDASEKLDEVKNAVEVSIK